MQNFEECVNILRQRHRVIESWVNNLDEEVLAAIQKDFDASGIQVQELYVKPEDWQGYVQKAGYRERYPDYYKDYMAEKSFEHFVAYRLLEIKSTDVFVDIASENSPVHEIFSRLSGCKSWRQDIMYPPGISGDRIGGNACEMPVPEHFATKMILTCSLEHFEGMEDQKLFFELSRVLKPGGKICIVPLYMYITEANQTDPTLSVPNDVQFDPDVTIYCAQGWRNRFGRFYSVGSLVERILGPAGDSFYFEVFRIMNATEVDKAVYARFTLIGTKK